MKAPSRVREAEQRNKTRFRQNSMKRRGVRLARTRTATIENEDRPRRWPAKRIVVGDKWFHRADTWESGPAYVRRPVRGIQPIRNQNAAFEFEILGSVVMISFG